MRRNEKETVGRIGSRVSSSGSVSPRQLGPWVAPGTVSNDGARLIPPPRAGTVVPEISRFYGISIRMYFNDHSKPHFHARYAGSKGTIEIGTLALTGGALPPRVLGLIVEWASLHRDELLLNWVLARRGDRLHAIAPLE
jgi:hypothetical protein